MKKFFTLLVSALCVYGAQAAQSVFSADFATVSAEDFAAWKVEDVNDDGKTWTYSETASPSHVYYTYHGSNAGDDWLISPAITIPASGVYILSYEFKGSSYGEAFEVWTGTSASVEGMKTKVAEHSNVGESQQSNMVFIDAEAGAMHLAFHCVSAPDKYRLYINSVNLLNGSNPVDLCVSEIISPVTGEGLGNETVKVKVSNVGRVSVDSYDVAFTVNGGEPVVEHVTAPLAVGESVEHTFAAKADLSLGRYTHVVASWTEHPDDVNPGNDRIETKVKHIAPAAVPYRMGFEADDDTSMMSYLNLNDDDGAWHIVMNDWFVSFSRTGNYCLGYNYNKQNDADDWAFLEPIEMEAGYYVLKFWYSATENHKERMKVFFGNEPKPEAMTNLIAEYDPMTNEHYAESINIFEVKEGGQIYIGFYCFSDANENWIVIDDLSIDKVDANWFDIAVGDLTQPKSYFRSGSNTDIAFTLHNVGARNADVTVNAYLDDKLIKTEKYAVHGQQILPVTMSKSLEGIDVGKHTVKVEAICDGDGEASNNVIEKTVMVVGDAVALWDFENGSLPSDLTLRKEDSAVNHPDSGEEFNEDGFGIYQLSTHPVLGTHALAVNTWFTDNTQADRWVVLPQMTVTGDDAHFVWNSNSTNNNFREKYEVGVSTTSDVWYLYKTEYTVNSEDVFVQTHGIDLGKYKDQNIYIGVNVKSAAGEALLLDNLGVYGDIRLASSGIDNISDASDCRIAVDGDVLKVYGAESESISVYGLDGALLVSVAGDCADISGLASGLYVARIMTSNGTVALKFVK